MVVNRLEHRRLSHHGSHIHGWHEHVTNRQTTIHLYKLSSKFSMFFPYEVQWQHDRTALEHTGLSSAVAYKESLIIFYNLLSGALIL